MKRLRGTRADIFGYAHLRKVERGLRDHYRGLVLDLAGALTAESYAHAVRIAELPDLVRGYETVKLGNVDKYVAELRELGVEPPRVALG